MPLDPSIILGGQGPQFQNPLDSANKAMTLQQLSLQNNQLQKQTSDSATMSDILKRNTVTDPNTGAVSINKQSALSDLYKVNPSKAMDLQKQWAQEDFDQVKKRTEMSKDLAWSMTPDNYGQVRQQAIQLGIPHAESLPPVYDPGIVQRLQMSTVDAHDKLNLMIEQRKNAAGIIQKNSEKGIASGPDLYAAAGLTEATPQQNQTGQAKTTPSSMIPANQQGLKTGDTIPGGEKDMAGQKVYDDSLANRRQNNPAYPQAEANLLAVKNANSVFNKYRDLNNLNTTDQHIVAMEGAKAMKGGASPTEDEVNALMPHNGQSLSGEILARTLGRPMPTNNAEHWQMLKDYFNDLKENSMNEIQSAHEEAKQNSIAAGISPNSLAIKQSAASKNLETQANGRYQSPDVSAFAKTHGISYQDAQAIKSKRTGGGQ